MKQSTSDRTETVLLLIVLGWVIFFAVLMIRAVMHGDWTQAIFWLISSKFYTDSYSGKEASWRR